MRNSRRWVGPVLFAVYTAGYTAFVLAAAFGTFRGGEPAGGLARPAVGGISWGVLAGFGLIVGAFALAALYAVVGAPARERAK